VTEAELVDFTPDIKRQALEAVKLFRLGPMFLPPVLSREGGPLAAITIGTLGGGTNWPGAGFDPETHIVYAQAANAGVAPLGLVSPPQGFSDVRYLPGRAGQEFRVNEGPGFGSAADAPQVSEVQRKLNLALGRPANAPPTPGGGGGGGALGVQGLPIVKPPYGLLAAINLDRGELMWQVPHGDTPDNVRNHPLLKGMNIPKTGQQGQAGVLITKTLVILGDPQVTTTPEHPRGAMLRAYNKQTGEQVGAIFMPAPQSGSPMTYSVDGRQYIIVAISGGSYSGEYLAFALPQSEVRPSQQ
jgi:quinoprotein glucose dehydrogenase